MRQFPDVKKMELEMRPLTSAEQTERSDYVITKQVTKVSRHIVTSSGPHGTIDNGYGRQSIKWLDSFLIFSKKAKKILFVF